MSIFFSHIERKMWLPSIRGIGQFDDWSNHKKSHVCFLFFLLVYSQSYETKRDQDPYANIHIKICYSITYQLDSSWSWYDNNPSFPSSWEGLEIDFYLTFNIIFSYWKSGSWISKFSSWQNYLQNHVWMQETLKWIGHVFFVRLMMRISITSFFECSRSWKIWAVWNGVLDS